MVRLLIGGCDRAAAFVACALVVVLLGCVALGVITRAFGQPLIWTDELSRFLLVWLAVFGWILGSRRRIHVRIRYFQDKLPAGGYKVVELGFQLALMLFGVLIAGYSVVLVGRNHDLEATSLPISMAWMYVPMVLAGAVTAVQGASEFLQALRKPGVAAQAVDT